MSSMVPPAFSTAAATPLAEYASSAVLPKGVSMTRTRFAAPAARHSPTSWPTTSGLVVAAYSGPW